MKRRDISLEQSDENDRVLKSGTVSVSTTNIIGILSICKVIDAPDETTIEVYAVDGGYNDNPLEFRLLGKVYVISELIGLSNDKIDSITK